MQVAAMTTASTRALSATASSIVRADPAEEAAQKLQAAKDAIATLKQIQSSQKDTAKTQAKQAVERLKERIKMLRMMCGGDPKALAKLVASLSKELAAAVKQYAAAGGTETIATDTTASDSSAASTDEESTDSATATPEQENTEEAPSPESSTTPQQDTAQKSDAYQKMIAGLEKQSQLLEGKSAEAKDSNDFMTEVRGLASQLKTFLKNATSRMDKSQQATNTDAADAEKALKEIDKAVNDASASANALTAVGGTVNISA